MRRRVRAPRGWQIGCTVCLLIGGFLPAIMGAAPSPAAADLAGGTLTPLTTPVRVMDTRTGVGEAAARPVGAGQTIQGQVAGPGGVPDMGAGAVVLNVTVTQPKAGGYVTVYPDGTPRPATSNLNFLAGQTIPNLVVVPLS